MSCGGTNSTNGRKEYDTKDRLSRLEASATFSFAPRMSKGPDPRSLASDPVPLPEPGAAPAASTAPRPSLRRAHQLFQRDRRQFQRELTPAARPVVKGHRAALRLGQTARDREPEAGAAAAVR